MKTRDQILNFLSQNKRLFRDKYHIDKIGLFGSYARGEQNNTSDLDLLVEFEENTQDLYEIKIQIKEFFKTHLGLEVDICREKYIKARIKNDILKEAIYAD
jgi:uncharacterized protein